MSEANLLLVLRFFEDRVQRNLETFLGFFDSEAEIDFSDLDRPYRRTSRGLEQIATLFREMNAPWQKVQFTATNAFSNGDHVVIDVERTAMMRPGGMGVTSRMSAAITARAGKIVSYKMFQDRADALRATGLTQ